MHGVHTYVTIKPIIIVLPLIYQDLLVWPPCVLGLPWKWRGEVKSHWHRWMVALRRPWNKTGGSQSYLTL